MHIRTVLHGSFYYRIIGNKETKPVLIRSCRYAYFLILVWQCILISCRHRQVYFDQSSDDQFLRCNLIYIWDVIKMLEYLIDNIFVEFGGRIFQQTIGILMGTNCAPLLADLFFIFVWGGVCTKSPQSRHETPCITIYFHLQIYRWCTASEKHTFCRIFGINLSTWTWNKGNNGDCSLLLILGLLSLHWQWKAYY